MLKMDNPTSATEQPEIILVTVAKQMPKGNKHKSLQSVNQSARASCGPCTPIGCVPPPPCWPCNPSK